MAKTNKPPSLDIIYDLALKRLDKQIEEIEALDTKAEKLATYAVLVTGLLFSIFGVTGRLPSGISLLVAMFNLLLFATVITIVFWRVFWPVQVHYLPLIERLNQKALFQPAHITKRATLIVVSHQIEHNRQIVRRKGNSTKLAFFLLLGHTVSALLAVLLWLLN